MTYTDAGSTALDNYDGNLTSSIITVNPVDTSVVGVYTLTYNVTDTNGNVALEVTRIVNVVDTTVPVITLTDEATVTIEVGSTYTDAGATALDNYDGDLTSSIVEVSTVDATTVGAYTVTYNITDANGNAAAEVTRTVNVVDTTVPVITLTGDATVTIEVGLTYTDAGSTALDNYDGDITSMIVEVSTVDTSVVGVYTVTYNVTDANGNAAVEVTRTVNVVDTTVPVITLLGYATVTIEVGSTYTDAGATATDLSGEISVIYTGTVDTSVVGTFTVTYNATDASGNEAAAVNRTVNVVDTTVPVIIVTGDITVTIEVGSTYTDAGVTASDNYDGDLTSSIVEVSTVDATTVGAYTVTYNITDANGNAAAEVTRTVNVVDTTVPVITLLGDATVTIEVGSTYTDAGADAIDTYDGDLTSSIVTVNPVDTDVVGVYTVTYNVTDTNGNAAVEVTRTVNIFSPNYLRILDKDVYRGASYDIDINLSNNDIIRAIQFDINIADGFDFDLETVIETSVLDDFTTTVSSLGNNNYRFLIYTISNQYISPEDQTILKLPVFVENSIALGQYTFEFSNIVLSSQTNQNISSQALSIGYINVIEDTIVPVITLTGEATVTIEVGSTYTDAGSTALDNYDGDLTSSIVTVITVDTAVVGVYTVTYNVTDSNGNVAVEVTRTVNIVDTTVPVITLTGETTVTIEVGSTYTDAGATALDNYDGDITSSIVPVSTFDTAVVGVYTVTYNVTDTNGNAAVEVARTVNVVDTTVPVITFTGEATVTIEVGSTYTDAGATALDNYDGDLTSSIVTVITVDETTVGVYTVTYNVTDGNGNAAVEVTRIVNVEDPLSLPEIEKIKLNIFPNPTSSIWQIKSSKIIESFDLFDLTGKRLIYKKTFSNDIRIDATSLADGIYLILINKNKMVRLIKH